MTTSPPDATARVTIVNRKGLHARASAKVAKLAADYDAQVIVRHEGEAADARSIMDLLMLVAHMGCEIELTGTGRQAREAVEAITALVADGFGERDGG
ncbi:MAG: HPr family phosphocarrier protein [Hyphomonas sp.]